MFRYVYNEIKYGGSLYISNWKKLLFHPQKAVKDLGKAIRHPIRTVKILGQEFTKHPIGMTVNIALNWATGRGIGEGIEYLGTLREGASALTVQNVLNASAPPSALGNYLETPTLSPNAPAPLPGSELTGFSSSVLQVIQYAGGCGCGGVCATATTVTTAGQMGQAAFLMSQKKASDTAEIYNNSITDKKHCDRHCSPIKLHDIVFDPVKEPKPLNLQHNSEQTHCPHFSPYFSSKRKNGPVFSSVDVNLENNEKRESCDEISESNTSAKKACIKTACQLSNKG